MKNMKYILAMCGLLFTMAACTDNHEPGIDQPADNWVMSRSNGSTIDEIRMVGIPKQGGGTAFDKTISFGSPTETGTWNGGAPTWNSDEVFDLYAIWPVTKPANDIVDTSVAYQMQYWADCTKNPDTRPTSYLLKHLHGMLKVHIDIHEMDTEDHEPQNVQIRLYQKGHINYPNEHLEPNGDLQWVNLTGWMHDQWELEDIGHEVDHKWVMEESIIIIPQELAMDGKPVVSFYLEDPHYGTAHCEYTPDVPMVLLPGKLTHLYIGVDYTHNEEDEEPVLTVTGFSVKITDWVADEEPTNGNATLQ